MRYGGVLVFLSIKLAAGLLVNKTIDDADPGVQYVGKWNAVTAANVDSCCSYRPDPFQMMDGTWHDGAVHMEPPKFINITFNGVAIYVYFALISNTSDITQISCTLDSATAGTYTHNQSSFGNQNCCPQFTYNQTIFSKQSLANTTHTLGLTLADTGDGVTANLALFDYAVVTQEFDDLPSIGTPSGTVQPTLNASPSISMSQHSSNVPSIVGGVVGALAALGLLVVALIILYRKRYGEHLFRDHTIPQNAMTITPIEPAHFIQPTSTYTQSSKNLRVATVGTQGGYEMSSTTNINEMRRELAAFEAEASQRMTEPQNPHASGSAGNSEDSEWKQELARLRAQVGRLEAMQQISDNGGNEPPPRYQL